MLEFLVYNAWLASTVIDTEGIHVVRLNPHLRQNYSIFMRNFKQNPHKLTNNHVQFSNRNLLCKFEPPWSVNNPGMEWSVYGTVHEWWLYAFDGHVSGM